MKIRIALITETMQFSLNVFLNSVTKIFVITIKGLEPANSCVKDQDATTCERQDL